MAASPSPTDASWRSAHLGHWLRLALARFDARVMECMAQHPGVPLGLSNLAARGQVSAAHIHITRHLPVAGARLNDLAQLAGMSKQAMGTLVNQCEAWGMVRREGHGADARAKRVVFTESGLAWLSAYQEAVAQAEAEMRGAVGDAVATVLALGLEAYSGG
ncbi:MAG: winged helix-turn-helix transcriptional regulator [Rhodoferax sp.]|nr:winged helix-turn-helix transcriptional regulator [Rhodoferax sp.]